MRFHLESIRNGNAVPFITAVSAFRIGKPVLRIADFPCHDIGVIDPLPEFNFFFNDRCAFFCWCGTLRFQDAKVIHRSGQFQRIRERCLCDRHFRYIIYFFNLGYIHPEEIIHDVGQFRRHRCFFTDGFRFSCRLSDRRFGCCLRYRCLFRLS